MLSLSEFGCMFARSIAILYLVSAVMLSCGCNNYSGPSEYQQLKQKQLGFSDLITAAGGKAKKEGKAMFGFQMAGWLIDLSGAKISDDLISALIEMGQADAVFQLNLSNSNITDEQLAKLDAGKVLQKTVELNLSKTAISDAGLDKLSNFYCLSDLNLTGTKATAAGAKRMGSKQISNANTPAPFKKQPKLKI